MIYPIIAVPTAIATSPIKIKIYAKVLTRVNLEAFLSASWNAFLAAEQKHMLRSAT